jgi:hypothetical protein
MAAGPCPPGNPAAWMWGPHPNPRWMWGPHPNPYQSGRSGSGVIVLPDRNASRQAATTARA